MPLPTSRQLSDQTIASTLAKFQVNATPNLCHSIRDYVDLLLLWNQKVNLTSVTDPLEILSRHFGESMFASAAIPDLHGRLADVGSGPGFPGLALKILRPDLEVFLIESVMKKAAFLAEVTRHLEISGVKVVVSRFEDLRDDLAPLDFICARALGDRASLLAWAAINLNIGGQVLLWLGAVDAKQIFAASASPLPNPASSSPPPISLPPHLAAEPPCLAEANSIPLTAPHPASSTAPPQLPLVPGHNSTLPSSWLVPCEYGCPCEPGSAPSDSPSLDENVPRETSTPQRSPSPTQSSPAPTPGSFIWQSPIQIPGSVGRYLLAGTQLRENS